MVPAWGVERVVVPTWGLETMVAVATEVATIVPVITVPVEVGAVKVKHVANTTYPSGKADPEAV